MKIEFYIRLYFALYANSSMSEDQSVFHFSPEEMKDFKKYLETKGASLSQNLELLNYFALPYIQNPLKHEKFAPLF
jgi:hypothetical protein